MGTVRRFRSAAQLTVSAPLSEGAESITAPASDTEKDGEKTEVRENARVAKAASIHQEDEEFEWREVFRGGNIVYRCRTASNSTTSRSYRHTDMVDRVCILRIVGQFVLVFSVLVSVASNFLLSRQVYIAKRLRNRPTIIAGLGFKGPSAQLHTG
jgi:hypothetical protein